MNSLVASWQARSLAARAAVILVTLSYLTHLTGAVFAGGLPMVERVLNFWALSGMLGLAVWGVVRGSRVAWLAMIVYAVVMLIDSAVSTIDGDAVMGAIGIAMYLALLVTLTRPDVVVRPKTAAQPETPDTEVAKSAANQVKRGIGTALIVLSIVVFGAALRWVGAEQAAVDRNPSITGELWVGYSTLITMLYVLPISVIIALIGVFLRKRK